MGPISSGSAVVYPPPVPTSEQGYSVARDLVRGVGVSARAADAFVFGERLDELNEELKIFNAEARELEERIADDVANLLA